MPNDVHKGAAGQAKSKVLHPGGYRTSTILSVYKKGGWGLKDNSLLPN